MYLYSVSDTAKMLGIGRTLTYQLLSSGELQSVRVGGRRMVTRGQIEAFVADLEQGLLSGS